MSESIPQGIDEVTPDWLTAVLRADGTIGRSEWIVDFSAEQIAVGTGFLSDLFRLRPTGAGPDSLIVKLPSSSDLYRAMGERSGAYAREVAFYREIAPYCPMRTPRAHAAELGPNGTGVLLLEDLGHLEAPDHIEGLPLERVGTVLDQLALHHAWGASDERPELDPNLFLSLRDRYGAGSGTGANPIGWRIYRENQRVQHDAAIDTLVEKLPARMPAIAELLAEPRALAHGDLRVDNLFFDDQGVVIVDHQFPLICTGLYDVAYLLSQGLRPEDRSGRDREFVEHYREAAAAAGLRIDAERAWRQYCAAVLLLLVYPMGAILGWSMLGERARELVLTLVERWIATVVALDLVDVDRSLLTSGP